MKFLRNSGFDSNKAARGVNERVANRQLILNLPQKTVALVEVSA